MSEFKARKAEEKDIPVIAEILSSATEYKVNHGDGAWGSEKWSEDEVKNAMSKSVVYLFQQGDKTVATVALQSEDSPMWDDVGVVANAGYIHRLAVMDGYHGQGIGSKILEWAKQELLRQGKQFIRLDCEASNRSLCAYYEGQGYVLVGTKALVERKGYVAALYEQKLL